MGVWEKPRPNRFLFPYRRQADDCILCRKKAERTLLRIENHETCRSQARDGNLDSPLKDYDTVASCGCIELTRSLTAPAQ
jgi:hypothetical protein